MEGKYGVEDRVEGGEFVKGRRVDGMKEGM